MNEIGVFMHQVDRWRKARPGYTPRDELLVFSPSKLYQRAFESPCDTVRLYNHFMRAIGYIVKKESGMGYCKVINKGAGRVVLVHQLGQDGKPYGETITFDVPDGVDASRNDWLAKQDGKIGVISYSFSAQDNISGVEFPEA